ncbi:MAG TPA: PqqD family peptide modification chaperone [Symbiobacteriaceae bacterium]|nr:PqqD family peptide modification chaperone [Symbiobacteriaceae bacterium]
MSECWKEQSREIEPEQIDPVAPPCEVELELTRACNLRCPHCWAAGGQPAASELSTDAWLRIIRELGDMGVMSVVLSGGEPFMRRDLLQLARGSTEAGLSTVISCTGWHVTDQVAQELAALGGIGVSISLDGPRELHDRFRQVPGAFDHAISAIRVLSRAGISVGATFMVTELSAGNFRETAALAAEAGARVMSVGQCGTFGRSSLELALSWDRWQEFICTVTDQAKAGELPLPVRGVWTGGWQLYLPLEDRLADAFSPSVWRKPPEVTPDCGMCAAGSLACGIDPEGYLYPCATMSSYPRLRCGSVADEGFSAVWQRSRLLHHVRSLDYRELHPCAGCSVGTLCHAGCIACTFGLTGQLHRPDPRCPRVAGEGAATADLAAPQIPSGEPYLLPLTALARETVEGQGSDYLEILGAGRRFLRYPRTVVAVAPGGVYVYLNRSALSMLREVALAETQGAAVHAIAQRFQISEERARTDLAWLLNELAHNGFLPLPAVGRFLNE